MKQGKNWTIEDEIYLMNNHNKMDRGELAKILGRNPLAITKKYMKMKKQGLINDEVIRDTRTKEKEERDEKNRVRARERYYKKDLPAKYNDEKFIQEAYEKLLKANIKDYGIGKKIAEVKFKKGQTYAVRIDIGKKQEKIFKGKLIQETKDLIVLKGDLVESFLKKDFLIGEYEIKEVRN